MLEKIIDSLATGPGYWFKKKLLYTDFQTFLKPFLVFKILYTVAYTLILAALVYAWIESQKRRKKTHALFRWEINRPNAILAGGIAMGLLIIATWLFS